MPQPFDAPQARRGFDAVVFDLDGTLIDTEALCNEAGVEACAALGLPVSPAFFESLAGIDDRTRARMIEEHVGRTVDVAAFFAAWDDLCTARFARGIPVKAGALDLLGRLRDGNVPMACATSSRRGPAEQKVAAAGLGPFFRTLVSVDDVAAPKPAPDPYLLACQRLGVEPARAVAFEDSETGARSAHAAGLLVVQVPDLHPTKGAHAHHVAATLLDGARAVGLIG